MKLPTKSFFIFSLLLFLDFSLGNIEGETKKEESSSAGSYVQVDGKKFTITDVERELNQEYKELVEETNDRLFVLLEKLGIQKLLQLEAKERKLSVQKYLELINKTANVPTEKELEEVYKNLKDSGQIKESYEETKAQLLDYIVSEKQQTVLQEEVSRLKKKFGFRAKRSGASKHVDIQGEPIRGNQNASITIVEFSDFECPFCLKSQSISRELRAKYGDKIKWVFKDFPLSFHQRAMDAHIAANCVFRQNKEKYWNYFDVLFSETRTQEILTPIWLESKAKDLGLDVAAYKACLKDEGIRKEIESDISEGAKLGINGTPTFIVNGKMIEGMRDREFFESLIESLE